jgi:hypothetical protein
LRNSSSAGDSISYVTNDCNSSAVSAITGQLGLLLRSNIF